MLRGKFSIVLNFLVASAFISLRCQSSNCLYFLALIRSRYKAILMYFMNFLVLAERHVIFL